MHLQRLLGERGQVWRGLQGDTRLVEARLHAGHGLAQQRERLHGAHDGRGLVAGHIHAGAQIAHELDQPHDLAVQAARGLFVERAHAVLHGLDLGAHRGQRRAQFMRGVPDPLAARGLDARKLLGHGVEGVDQAGEFLAVGLFGNAGVQLACRNGLRAGHQRVDGAQPAPRQPPGQQQRQRQARHAAPHHETELLGQEGAVRIALQPVKRRQHQVADQAPLAVAQRGPRTAGNGCGARDHAALRIHHAQAPRQRVHRRRGRAGRDLG